MWFAIVLFFRAFDDCTDRIHFYHADNEGDLPDLEFVFEAANGQGPNPITGLPRSLSVGDFVAIVPINSPTALIRDTEHRDATDWLLSLGHNVAIHEVLPTGWRETNLHDYLQED